MPDREAMVIGCGVIGLTTAVLLLSSSFKVTIVASAVPSRKSGSDPAYASPEAGAYWLGSADGASRNEEEMETIAYNTLVRLSAHAETGIMPVKTRIMTLTGQMSLEDPWFATIVSNYRRLSTAELQEYDKEATVGYEFDSVTINVPKYLDWLMLRFKALGGKLVVKTLSSIEDAATYGVPFVFNCSGFGAKALVNDTKMVPIRGQTILIRSPDASKLHLMCEIKDPSIPDIAYIVPRQDGTVLLGGTYDVDTYNATPSSETAERIFKRCQRLSPQLRNIKDLSQLKVVRHGVGVRPHRSGGPRVEMEYLSGGKSVVIHNYGHGRGGYLGSWGSAQKALDLALQHCSASNSQASRL
eukprot:Partr_v1_DN26099_c4_g2_i1_m731 putative D-aminoacid oxidase